MPDDVFAQDGYRLRLEWGPDSLAALAPQCAVLVVVDVLSFSTSAAIVVDRSAGGHSARTPLTERRDPVRTRCRIGRDRPRRMSPQRFLTSRAPRSNSHAF
jgi:hypothetical protein